jgi:O-antigen ligase
VLWLVLLPLFVYVASVESLSLFLGLPTAILVAGLLIAATRGKRLIARPRFPTLLFAAFVVFAAISATFSEDPLAAQSRIVYLVAYGVFGWAVAHALATGLISHMNVVRAIVWSAAVASVPLIVQFIGQYLLGREELLERLVSVQALFAGDRAARGVVSNWLLRDPLFIGDDLVRGVFPFMSPASAGQYLMVGLLAAIWLLRQSRGLRSGREVALSWGAAAVIGLALFLTFSRQSWIGALVGLALLGRSLSNIRLVVVGVVSVVLAASLLPVPGSDRTFLEYFALGRDLALSIESGGGRLEIWKQVPDDVAESPVIGVGPGQYSTLADKPDVVYYAHNVVLDNLVELGVVGGILTVVLLVALLRNAARKSPGLGLPLLAAWLVANMVDDTVYFPRNGFVFATIVALSSVELWSCAGVGRDSVKVTRTTTLTDGSRGRHQR